MSIRTVLLALVLACSSLVSSTVAAEGADARAELIALWAKMFDSRDLAFSATVATTDNKGRVTTSEMRANWPNKFHMKSQESEFIIIGDSTWMKPQGQNWMKFPMSMSKMIDAYKPEIMKASMEGTSNVRYLRDDAVNGRDCKVFAYDFDVKVMGFRSQGTSTVFLDKSSGYPVRVETDGEAMGQRSKTVVDYVYDPGIRVVAPD
jgi:outer membrane lipoprotein-sorting protein